MGRIPAEDKEHQPEATTGEAHTQGGESPAGAGTERAAANDTSTTGSVEGQDDTETLDTLLAAGQVHPVVAEALEAAQRRAKEAEDRMLRAVAEAQNERRRLAKEQSDRIRFANESLLSEMLSVLDNLQLCVAHAADGADVKGVRTGVEMTLAQFKQVIQNVGAKEIEVEVGAPFEPKEHEALIQDDEADLPPRTVTRVLQAGFTYHERVLRPARVAVSTGKGQNQADGTQPLV